MTSQDFDAALEVVKAGLEKGVQHLVSNGHTHPSIMLGAFGHGDRIDFGFHAIGDTNTTSKGATLPEAIAGISTVKEQHIRRLKEELAKWEGQQ